jgi:alpha-L-glutamate ligase-like protein
MFQLFSAARRLREAGVLGMNRRNAQCILDHNPRRLYPLVDGKLRLQELCKQIDVPTPEVYASIKSYALLRRLGLIVGERDDFVIKPNRGSAGRGVLVLVGRTERGFIRHSGETIRLEQLRQHVSDILSGMYSLGGRPDEAFLQERVRLHPDFAAIAHKGIPDVRIILYRHHPAMAMLRLPTQASNGRANLHQGGIGAGIDITTGITVHAVQKDRSIEFHPDSGESVLGVKVPCWPEVLVMACKVARFVGLGYLGVDIVIDDRRGPMLLEANARPGLAIQIANRQGLLKRLEEIDRLSRRTSA